jgi:hypothetical protein
MAGFRFVSWFSPAAGNAGRWAFIHRKNMKLQTTLTILLLTLVSCAPATKIMTPVTSTHSIPTPTLDILPTEAASTPTSEPYFTKQQCLTDANLLSEEKNLTGALILADKINSGKYFIFDLRNMKEDTFMGDREALYDLTVSPNHKLTYYGDLAGNEWKNVISTSKDVINQFPYSIEWVSSKWLDDEHLIYGRSGDTPDNTLRIFDPLTGADRTISLDIPNPAYFLHPNGKYYLIVNVNKDLSRAVFFDTYDRGRIIMWDLKDKKMLASLPYLVSKDPEQTPAVPFFYGWSPDETKFVTTSPVHISTITGKVIAEELFSISQDGNVKQLTYLSDDYNYVRISEPSWSPDGLSIAFWLQVSKDENQDRDNLSQQLVSLNTETGEITDYCLSHGQPKYSAVDRPLWLSDSNHLIVESRDSAGTSETNIIDLQNNSLSVLAHDRSPLDWVMTP